MKNIGYLIFAGFYYFFCLLCRVKPRKVFGIMTHDSSRDGNVGVMAQYLKQQKAGYSFQFLKKADRKITGKLHGVKGIFSFFVIKSYHLATSQFIMMDNTFLPMAYLKFRKNVKVIQLWHGTGTIKRLGQDTNNGVLKRLEQRANSCITNLIVNSEESKKEYAQAFGIAEDKVFICGLPRTDLFFHEEEKDKRRQGFYQQYPDLKGKKLILYAPTFRDQEKDNPKMYFDTELFCNRMPNDYVLMLRLHPYVAESFEREELPGNPNQVRNVSFYKDINTLLLVSDYLITDYSSVIFEYCLQNKPMIFYAYDLEQFRVQGRGFYRPYQEYVPGPVVKSTEEIIELLKKKQFDLERVQRFTKDNYSYLDGKSAERIYEHIIKG